MEVLGDNKEEGGLKSFGFQKPFGDVPKLVPENSPQKQVTVPSGYYIISYKRNDEGSNGRNYYVVSDHTNIEKFVIERLAFGEKTRDIHIIEKADDFIEANSIATILTLEENFEGGIKKLRFGGMLMAKYTWKELWNGNTKLKWY